MEKNIKNHFEELQNFFWRILIILFQFIKNNPKLKQWNSR